MKIKVPAYTADNPSCRSRAFSNMQASKLVCQPPSAVTKADTIYGF